MKKLLIVLLALLVLAPSIAYADWPQARHDAGHTSVADSALKPPLAVDWQKSAGGEVITSPVLYNGTLFVGNGAGKSLLALDPATGAQKWSFPTPSSVESTPAAANGSVVFGSYDGYVYRLDMSGQQQWKSYVQGGVYSSPLIYNNKVFVGTDDGSFYALDFQSGTGIWTLPKATQASPAADAGRIFIGMLDGTFYAMNASTGTSLWTYETQASFHSSPLVYNGTVYVATRNGTLYAFDEGSGEVRWTYDLGYATDTTPSVDPSTGTIYIGTYGGRVFAFDANGAREWVSAYYGPIYQSVTVSGDVLYGASQKGTLFALDKAGKELWTYDLGESAFASPVVDGGRLYMATMGGNVFSFKHADAAPTPVPSASPTAAASTPFLDILACAAVLVAAGLCHRSR